MNDNEYTMFSEVQRLDEYAYHASKTAVYPPWADVLYPVMGLAGEVGELCNKVKKVIRDSGYDPKQTDLRLFLRSNPEILRALVDELGDVLWYVATIANDLDVLLSAVAKDNLNKLASRKARGTLKGSGDAR